MKIVTSWIVGAVGLGLADLAGACEIPPVVAVPDGESASMEQLLEAQDQIKTYLAAMDEYRACINGELEAAGKDATAEFRALMVTRHDSAVTEMESVAAAFNAEVKAFREANPPERAQ